MMYKDPNNSNYPALINAFKLDIDDINVAYDAYIDKTDPNAPKNLMDVIREYADVNLRMYKDILGSDYHTKIDDAISALNTKVIGGLLSQTSQTSQSFRLWLTIIIVLIIGFLIYYFIIPKLNQNSEKKCLSKCIMR